jgi:hypothetical protein
MRVKQVDLYELEANLVYKMMSWTFKATQWEIDSKKKKKKKKKKHVESRKITQLVIEFTTTAEVLGSFPSTQYFGHIITTCYYDSKGTGNPFWHHWALDAHRPWQLHSTEHEIFKTILQRYMHSKLNWTWKELSVFQCIVWLVYR